ncbi:SDR family NAD(P)-dependent oxidoreductase [Hydrogenophaga sp. UC242_50]|jgi:phthiocerol/phenolphthiocerol synthesis type-I polyketide synthase B|uniref:type I polyketide synthase n=1 Tax=unclassified Hydrogenophaga TaxID=2610897 RepID=UPI0036D3D161
MNHPSKEPVAIVGIGCRFPGGVIDSASFWRLLSEGQDAIGEVPADRIDLQRFFDARPATPGRMMSRRGGFLDRMDLFDADFFGISPREAQVIDPQQRVLLETAWEALEDAGQDVPQLEGSDTAVYIGQWVSDFESRLFAQPEAIDFPSTLGSGRYASSGRISYVFGFRGPSLTIDSACSSSLAAVHLAVRSLRSGETRLALAGGVNMILQPHITIGYSQSRMMAADGHCKFGDASGDGYVRSEGAGLVVLKRLADAVRDGDRIYAVIRGSAVNNDGRSSGVMGRPSRIGHEEMLRAAYRDAGVAASQVSYVEAHGTGTRAGDPVEIAALGAVLGDAREAGSTCHIGSVKTNIGHTEGAAGVAGLIKAALALHHGAVPASLHFVNPNPGVPWGELPFRVPTSLAAWPASGTPRVAGVNSFGIAGTNAHVVLQEAPAVEAKASPAAPGPAVVLPLSARSPEALRALASRYADRLADAEALALEELCQAAALRRSALEVRAAFAAQDAASLREALQRFASGEGEGVQARPGERPRLAFVVPGQGAQWSGMARQLIAHEPVFRDILSQCDAAARPYLDVSILALLQAEPGSADAQLDRIDVVQPVLVSLAIAYAALLRSWGVEPDAVVGHSMGEVGAACIAGVLDIGQAMQIVCARSRLMRRVSGLGAMALVELSMEDARQRLRGREDRLSVAVSNSPRSSVISGEPEAVQAVMAELEREQIFCRLVKVDVASHSPQMEPLAQELAQQLDGLSPSAARCPLYSTVRARRVEGHEMPAAYWADNLRRPVLFSHAVEQMLTEGITVFVELGPHPVLLPSLQQTAQIAARDIATVACGHRDEPACLGARAALGALWTHGIPVDWRASQPAPGRWVDLPSYPWQRERHWADAAEVPSFNASGAPGPTRKPDAASLDWLYQLQWTASDPSHDSAPRASRWLVVGAADEALVAALRASGMQARGVPLAGLHAALAEPCDHVVLWAKEDATAPFLPLQALRALRSAGSDARLWFITQAAQAVVPGERVQLQQGALWGSARVLAEEHPEHWGGLIDLGADFDAARGAGALADHLLCADGEDQVAWRGPYRHVLCLARAERDRLAQPFAWRADAAYLITGGLGGVAGHVARAMVEGGARRLVLLGRTPLPERAVWGALDPASAEGRRVAAVRALEAQGASVHVAAVDVADKDQLQAFLARYAAEAWPAIRGVVHAAGTFDNRLASQMDEAAFDAVLRPKLQGARWLDQLLPDLDLFVTFSSTGAVFAQAGQANYAAANAGLDALAQDRRARGLPALSIGWGVWAGTGLVHDDAGARNVAQMERQGIRAFEPAQGAALFPWLCQRREAHLIVVPLDWAAFAMARAGRSAPLCRDLLAALPAAPVATTGLGEQLATAAPAERRRLLEGLVKEAVGAVLRIAPARLDPRKALGSMGLNSLMAMELRNRLEAATGRSLSATLAWNYPTVEALAAHLAGADAAAPVAPPAQDAPPPPAAPVVAALSDEDALLALRGNRRRGGG